MKKYLSCGIWLRNEAVVWWCEHAKHLTYISTKAKQPKPRLAKINAIKLK